MASFGTAMDDLGNLLDGARPRLLSESRGILCVDTEDNRYDALPDAGASEVRLGKRGPIPTKVAAVVQESPVVLLEAEHEAVVEVQVGTER